LKKSLTDVFIRNLPIHVNPNLSLRNFEAMKTLLLLLMILINQNFAQAQRMDSSLACASFAEWATLLFSSDFPEPEAIEGMILLTNEQVLHWKKQPAEKQGSYSGIILELYLINLNRDDETSTDW
jgi:hypothetical protein